MRPQSSGPTLSPSSLAAHREDGFVRAARIAELEPGIHIRAVRGGVVAHAGPITEIPSAQDLPWIFDEQSRTRKIIETHDFTIVARAKNAVTVIQPKEQP